MAGEFHPARGSAFFSIGGVFFSLAISSSGFRFEQKFRFPFSALERHDGGSLLCIFSGVVVAILRLVLTSALDSTHRQRKAGGRLELVTMEMWPWRFMFDVDVWEGLPQYAYIRLTDEKKLCVEHCFAFGLECRMHVACFEVVRGRNIPSEFHSRLSRSRY